MLRNITLNAEDEAIDAARALMKAEGTSLNEQFSYGWMLTLPSTAANNRLKQL